MPLLLAFALYRSRQVKPQVSHESDSRNRGIARCSATDLPRARDGSSSPGSHCPVCRPSTKGPPCALLTFNKLSYAIMICTALVMMASWFLHSPHRSWRPLAAEYDDHVPQATLAGAGRAGRQARQPAIGYVHVQGARDRCESLSVALAIALL